MNSQRPQACHKRRRIALDHAQSGISVLQQAKKSGISLHHHQPGGRDSRAQKPGRDIAGAAPNSITGPMPWVGTWRAMASARRRLLGARRRCHGILHPLAQEDAVFAGDHDGGPFRIISARCRS